MALVTSGHLEAEGFLCPLCMKDLISPAQLEQHWKKSHPQEDNDVLRQLKGLFGKARKFLRIEDDGSLDSPSSLAAPEDVLPNAVTARATIFDEPQELGETRQHTEYFQKARSLRNDRYVMETNKIIVRLGKLISPESATADKAKRKELEQKLVKWAADADFPLCMTCGLKFGRLSRRRHHCRLCGGIMCDRCSNFLRHDFARQLTETHVITTDVEREKNMASTAKRGFLQRRGSDSSLSSYATEEGGPHVRTCEECRKLLEKRYEQNQRRLNKEVIVEYYEKMQEAIKEAAKLTPEFLSMADSLINGECTYSLEAATSKRLNITRLYEFVDNISKRILTLDADNEELVSQRQMALQKSIRDAAAAYLRTHAYSLPYLPSADEYAKRRAARDAGMKLKLDADMRLKAEAEKRAAAAANQAVAPTGARTLAKSKEASRPSTSAATTNGDVPKSSLGIALSSDIAGLRGADHGLCHTPNSSADGQDAAQSDDPLVVQIHRVKEYLVQAEAAQLWDEVDMLRANLSMLQLQAADVTQRRWRPNGAASP